MAFDWFKKEKKKPLPTDREQPDTGKPIPGSPDNCLDGSEPAPGGGGGGLHDEEVSPVNAEPESKEGVFHRLRKRLSKTRKGLSIGLESIFSGKKHLDDSVMEELEELLITSDIGVQTSMDLIQNISRKASGISDARQFKYILKQEIIHLLSKPSLQSPLADSVPETAHKPHIILVLGVNGVGKTTTIGKLASKYTASGKSVLVGAADTFRAAAIDQLAIWAERAGADIIRHKENADPAAVTYDTVEAAVARGIDVVLIDTAGRIHTKVNLMEELKKIRRTISKIIPDAPHETLLVLDATTGQNALSQTRLFHEAMGVTGIALTKLDGTAKGGIAIGICATMNIPLKYIGIGEHVEDLQDFDPVRFADALL